MRNVLLALATLMLLACTGARADVATGWAAYLHSDYVAALKELKPLAEAGNADAQYALGSMYSDGLGVRRSPRDAALWFEKAAQQGHADAQFSLGFLLLYGAGEGANAAPADAAAGLPWLEKAAAQGNGPAQYFVGYVYWTGLGVTPDRDKARQWSLRAADRGVIDAQYQAGTILASERGAANAVEAYKWLELAARQGDARAVRARDQLAAERLAPAELEQAKHLADAWRPR